MFVEYLKRGVLAGALAGLAFGVLVALVANPLVGLAEGAGHGGAHDAGGGQAHADHRSTVPAVAGHAASVASGVLWGVLLGGVVFGVAYYTFEPAIPGTGATKSYVLAAAGFLTVSGAPWLVLPPRPPGVEAALSTETRIVLYGGMMVAGALVSLLSGVAYRRLHGDRRPVTAAAIAVLPIGLLAVPAALSPATAVAGSLPSELTAGLTGLVVFGQALLWLVLAATHARLCRSTGRSDSDTTFAGKIQY
ncbi:MAG: CbtA family protein [Salinirussus sp.]